MKATGVVRKIDDLGRITLPIELRRNLEINIGDPVEIFVEGNSILLKKYVPGCSCCKEVTSELKEVDGIKLCTKCIQKIKKL